MKYLSPSPPLLLTLSALVIFFAFGLFHLTKFETTDEHFWKYERIPAYWQAWKDSHWKKTYINDKPGVSVALIAGPGLLFSDPEQHRVRDSKLTEDGTFTLYDVTQTESLNFAIRFPILLFNTFLLFIAFMLARRAFASAWISAYLVTTLAGIPLLIGLSQILNPDSLLWSTSLVALLAWLAFLERRHFRYVVLTALFTTLAILSKYTGNFLWPLFLAFGLTFPLFRPTFLTNHDALRRFLKQFLYGYTLIILFVLLLVTLLLPAIIVKPILLWKSTFGFLANAHLLWPLLTSLLLISLDTFLLRSRVLTALFRATLSHSFVRFTRILLIVPALFFLSVLVSGPALAPLLQTAKENDALVFPLLTSFSPPFAFLLKMMSEATALTASLPPLFWVLILFWYFHVWRGSASPRLTFTLIVSWFSLAFFGAALFEDVLLNARYSVVLLPLFALLTAFALDDLTRLLSPRFFPRLLLPLALLITGVFNLWQIKPFFFNYTTPLLPKTVALHDGWGLGYFEAATYLNTLPNKDQLVIWSDRNVICPFLDGPRCLSGYRLDLSRAAPDYFILSKRGVERNYIPRDKKTSAPLLDYTRLPEYAREAIWRLNIDDRPDNFVMIVPNKTPPQE